MDSSLEEQHATSLKHLLHFSVWANTFNTFWNYHCFFFPVVQKKKK